MYTGQFLDGFKHGFGKWKKSKQHNSNTYEGYYYKNKKEGFGIFKWISGNTYIGHYKNDEREGIGQMIWTDKSMYIGEWKVGIQHGYGRMTFPNGKVKEGLFDRNIFKGTNGLESYNIPKELLDKDFDIMSYVKDVQFNKEMLKGRTRNVSAINQSSRDGVYATQKLRRSLLSKNTDSSKMPELLRDNATLSESEKIKNCEVLQKLMLRREGYKRRRVLKSLPKRGLVSTGKSTVLSNYTLRGLY